jgi:hypothetical protein
VLVHEDVETQELEAAPGRWHEHPHGIHHLPLALSRPLSMNLREAGRLPCGSTCGSMAMKTLTMMSTIRSQSCLVSIPIFVRYDRRDFRLHLQPVLWLQRSSAHHRPATTEHRLEGARVSPAPTVAGRQTGRESLIVLVDGVVGEVHAAPSEELHIQASGHIEAWLGGSFAAHLRIWTIPLRRETTQALLVEEDLKGVETRHRHVQPNVKLVALCRC